MNDEHELPNDWETRNSHACFFEYVELVRQQWLAGDRDLPPLFQPTPLQYCISQTQSLRIVADNGTLLPPSVTQSDPKISINDVGKCNLAGRFRRIPPANDPSAVPCGRSAGFM